MLLEPEEVPGESSPIEQKQRAVKDCKWPRNTNREKVEKELQDICNDVLALLDKYLIAKASNAESKYFPKMKETTTDTWQKLPRRRKQAINGDSQKAYQDAFDAKSKMQPTLTHPAGLGPQLFCLLL